MADVSLSYRLMDADVTKHLSHSDFERLGSSSVWDRDSIRAGEIALDAISEALAEGKAFVLLHPGEVGSSDFRRLETDAAVTRSNQAVS